MMKVALIASLMTLAAASAGAAVIAPAAAGAHAGQSVTVEGQVSEVHTARSGKETFVDMGGTYPNQAFTGVIFQRSMAAVGDVKGLTGRTVDMTGTIQIFDGKPEMIITARDQIRPK
jgi:exonuclease VII large subunit